MYDKLSELEALSSALRKGFLGLARIVLWSAIPTFIVELILGIATNLSFSQRVICGLGCITLFGFLIYEYGRFTFITDIETAHKTFFRNRRKK